MFPLPPRRVCLCVWILLGALRAGAAPAARPNLAPLVESAPRLLDAWRLAENYVAAHPGCEVFVGRGDSMLPLYHDRTVIVVRQVAMKDLQAGMAVVFTGDQGRLVAHTLLERTLVGWRAIGIGNQEPDRTPVRRSNLVGVVVKAYAAAPAASVVALQ